MLAAAFVHIVSSASHVSQASTQRTRMRTLSTAPPDWTDADEAMAWCETMLDDCYERVNAALELEAAALARLKQGQEATSAAEAPVRCMVYGVSGVCVVVGESPCCYGVT